MSQPNHPNRRRGRCGPHDPLTNGNDTKAADPHQNYHRAQKAAHLFRMLSSARYRAKRSAHLQMVRDLGGVAPSAGGRIFDRSVARSVLGWDGDRCELSYRYAG